MTTARGARTRAPRRALFVALAGGLAALLGTAPLAARPILIPPLPHLRPTLPGQPAGPAAPAQPAPKRSGFQLFRPFASNPASRFSPADQQVLANISAYFNSFQTMQGQFVQFGPHGEQSEGVFYIARPGKIRFHYSPPVKLDVIADGYNVAVRDNRAMTQDYYPLSKTPLRYLLAANVDLTNDRLVSDVHQAPDLVSVLIVERTAFAQGKLTLLFDAKTYELKQWIVTDAQGLNTSVAIYNTTTGKPADPGLFKIVYTEQGKP